MVSGEYFFPGENKDVTDPVVLKKESEGRIEIDFRTSYAIKLKISYSHRTSGEKSIVPASRDYVTAF